jgi:Spy/CpxP family protein refolding chaperone
MKALCTACSALSLIAALALATPVIAQTATDDKELTKSVISTQRQAIVADNLNLTDEQGKVFWPLFRQYGAEMDMITDRKLHLMEEYAKEYNSLTDQQAASVMNDYFAIQKDELKAREKWFGKFSKDLPIKTVTRFFQIEYKLDAIIRAEMTRVIPLVSDQVAPARSN